MTRCDIQSRRSRLLARNPVLNRYSLQGRSQQLTNHGDVVIEVIRCVELHAFSIRIQHADLYHEFLLLVIEHTRRNLRTNGYTRGTESQSLAHRWAVSKSLAIPNPSAE